MNEVTTFNPGSDLGPAPKTESGVEKKPAPPRPGQSESAGLADRLEEAIEKVAPYPIHD